MSHSHLILAGLCESLWEKGGTSHNDPLSSRKPQGTLSWNVVARGRTQVREKSSWCEQIWTKGEFNFLNGTLRSF